jgi:aspartyl-tRNA synthetase
MSTGSSISDGASSAWSSTKNFFGYGDDKKDTKIKSEIPKVGTPVNNINFKSSSLQEKKIPIIPIESVSAVTNSAITETKSFMQNNTHTNNTQGVTQTVTNHVTIHAHDGKIDEDDLYEKLGRVNRRMAHDEQDLQHKDVS